MTSIGTTPWLMAGPTFTSGAGNVLKRIDDVPGVQNDFEVLPASRNGDQIRAVTYAIIYCCGVVESDGVLALAELRACSGPGEFSVQNDLDPWRSLWRE